MSKIKDKKFDIQLVSVLIIWILIGIIFISIFGLIVDAEINRTPIANVGPDQNVKVGYTVYFDGSDSWDPNNNPLLYKWDFGDGTSIEWQDNSISFHTYYLIGNYTVNLTVSDGELISTDTCIVRVLPKSSLDLKLDESPWPMFQGNALHTGLSSYDTNNNTGKLRWKSYVGCFSANNQEASSVIGSDGTIYVGSTTYNIGYLYSINRYGELNWKFSIGNNEVSSSPAIGPDGTIYMGSEDEHIYALYPDGALKWKSDIKSYAYSSLTIDSDNTLYYGSDDCLMAVNPNGTQKWKFKTNCTICASPTIGLDNIIYFHERGPDHSILYAIRSNASLKWKYEMNNLFETTPVIGLDGTIYIGAYDSFLYAIDPKGTLKWKFKTERSIHSAPAIGADGTIYLSSDNFYAINSDGIQKWKLEILECGNSPTVIGSDGTIYVGGKTITTTNTGSYNGPTYLFAINPDGTIKWQYGPFSNDDYLYSPAIGSDGTIYIGSSDEYLYAIGNEVIDTDNDNIPDDWEIRFGFNPINASDVQLDQDNDSLTNLQEYQLGTDPTNKDTDNDGYLDNIDEFPTDPSKHIRNDITDKSKLDIYLIIIIVIFIILVLIILKITLLIIKKNKHRQDKELPMENKIYRKIMNKVLFSNKGTELINEELKIILKRKYSNGEVSQETYDYINDFIENSMTFQPQDSNNR